MVRKRFDDLDEQRREGIFDAAAAEFEARGYDGASINRIIEQAGISKGTLYYYFDDKEDLFSTVVEYAMTRLTEGIGIPSLDHLDKTTFWNAYRSVMLRSVEFLQRNARYVRLARSFFKVRAETPGSQVARRVAEMGRSQLHKILSRGQDLGVVRTDLPLPLLVEVALAVDEAGDRWRLEHWNDFTSDERIRIADAHIDLIRDMLHAKNQGWEE